MVLAEVRDRAGQEGGRVSPGEGERWPTAGSVVIPPPEEASCLPACSPWPVRSPGYHPHLPSVPLEL